MTFGAFARAALDGRFMVHRKTQRGRLVRKLKELRQQLKRRRLIEFGRFAATNRRRRSAGRPETFDFLGFTHYCGWDTK